MEQLRRELSPWSSWIGGPPICSSPRDACIVPTTCMGLAFDKVRGPAEKGQWKATSGMLLTFSILFSESRKKCVCVCTCVYTNRRTRKNYRRAITYQNIRILYFISIPDYLKFFKWHKISVFLNSNIINTGKNSTLVISMYP